MRPTPWLGLGTLLAVACLARTLEATTCGVAIPTAMWPPLTSVLPRNPVFLVAFWGARSGSNAYLVCGGHRVRLKTRPITGLPADFRALAPSRPLASGTTCELFANRASNEPRTHLASWLVGEALDDVPPRWLGEPSISFAQSSVSGASAEFAAEFALKLPVEDEQPVAALVELKAPISPSTSARIAFLQAAPGRPVILRSGDVCSHFRFPRNEVIEVAISVLDTAGNRAPAPGRVRFRVPSPRPEPTFEARTVIHGPLRVLHRPEPEWPGFAIRTRFDGDVTGEMLVSVDGTVSQVTTKSGHPLLSRPTTDALSTWRFSPIGLSEPSTVYFTTHFLIVEQEYSPDWSQ
jgi:hypothetical protein